MMERLRMANGSDKRPPEDLSNIANIIGRRVRTDPSGMIALGEEPGIPFGTPCRLIEIGPEGTFGIVIIRRG